MTALTRWATALTAAAADLDSNRATRFPHTPPLEIPDPLAGHSQFTIAVWACIDHVGTQAIVSNWWRGGTCGWGLGLTTDLDGRVEFRMYDQRSGTNRGWISDVNYPTGEWCHIGVTLDGNTCRFYLDGQENVRDTLKMPVTVKPNTTHPLRIGDRVIAGGDELLHGQMRDLIIRPEYCAPPEWFQWLHGGGHVDSLDGGVRYLDTDTTSLRDAAAFLRDLEGRIA